MLPLAPPFPPAAGPTPAQRVLAELGVDTSQPGTQCYFPYLESAVKGYLAAHPGIAPPSHLLDRHLLALDDPCPTLAAYEERVCGPGCRSGSSLYIYRVYFSRDVPSMLEGLDPHRAARHVRLPRDATIAAATFAENRRSFLTSTYLV
jgi:hypothetical protein